MTDGIEITLRVRDPQNIPFIRDMAALPSDSDPKAHRLADLLKQVMLRRREFYRIDFGEFRTKFDPTKLHGSQLSESQPTLRYEHHVVDAATKAIGTVVGMVKKALGTPS